MSYLVLILAGDCGACINFKKTVLPNLKVPVPVLTVAYPSLKSSLPTRTTTGENVPTSLQNYIQYFPTLMLVNKNDWNSGRLNPVVYDSNQGIDTKSIVNWVNKNVERNQNRNSFNYPKTIGNFYSANDTFKF